MDPGGAQGRERADSAERGSGDGGASSIAAALDVVGDRWTILILRDAFRGIRRYDELRRDLDIPRAVLADRLRRLVEHGVLVKQQYQDRPPRHEYRLTRMGLELSPILVALMHWGDRWLSEGEPPTLLVHEPCGTAIDLGFHCWTCGEDFSPRQITSRPGPGSSRDTTGSERGSTTSATSQRTARPAAS